MAAGLGIATPVILFGGLAKFPADLDLTLGWLPTTELDVVESTDGISTHELADFKEGTRVRVLPVGQNWPVSEVKDILKDG